MVLGILHKELYSTTSNTQKLPTAERESRNETITENDQSDVHFLLQHYLQPHIHTVSMTPQPTSHMPQLATGKFASALPT